MRYLVSLFLGLSIVCYGSEKIGTVTNLKGAVSAINEREKEGRDLSLKSDVYLGDTLMTDDTSKAEVKFKDGTKVFLIPNSVYSVAQYSEGSSNRYLAFLRQGGVRVSTGMIAKKNPENFEIGTPDATIGVRGTTLIARIEGQTLYVGSESGKVSVTNSAGEVTMNPNQYAMASSTQVPPKSLPARPEALSSQIFSWSSSGVLGGGSVEANLAGNFAWAPAIGGVTIIGVVVGVVAWAATQGTSNFAHLGSTSSSTPDTPINPINH